MCLGEHKFGETVLGDTVSAPLDFFFNYWRFFIKFKGFYPWNI